MESPGMEPNINENLLCDRSHKLKKKRWAVTKLHWGNWLTFVKNIISNAIYLSR